MTILLKTTSAHKNPKYHYISHNIFTRDIILSIHIFIII